MYVCLYSEHRPPPSHITHHTQSRSAIATRCRQIAHTRDDVIRILRDDHITTCQTAQPTYDDSWSTILCCVFKSALMVSLVGARCICAPECVVHTHRDESPTTWLRDTRRSARANRKDTLEGSHVKTTIDVIEVSCNNNNNNIYDIIQPHTRLHAFPYMHMYAWQYTYRPS